jgi:hypothetical protein
MITLTINSVDYEIEYTNLSLNSIENNFTELRSPKTGFRRWVGGNYLFLKFFVWLCNYDDPQNAYETIAGYVGNNCYLSLNHCNYITTHGDDIPLEFYVLSCEPYYYDKTLYDVCNLTLKTNIRTQERYLSLIDDLGNYILTDDGQRIRVDL